VKDIPGVAWIVGGFILLALALFLYSRSGPEALPPVESPWSQVDDVRERIRTRKIGLKVGESMDETSRPYRAQVKRLKDLEGPQPIARYVLSVRLIPTQFVKNSWLGEGVDVAFLDLQPSEVFGSLRLVSFRKVEPKL
jgi:hypothetical protein